MFKVSIIGQGYVGFPLAIHAAEAGNTVIGFDIDAGKVSDINSGRFITPGLDSEVISMLIKTKKYIPDSEISRKRSTKINTNKPLPVDREVIARRLGLKEKNNK